MPVKDDSLVAQYIRALENPDSLGYRNGIWTDAGVFDSRNRGFGVDVENNIAAARLAKNRPGKWLTEEEERNIRLSHIGDNQTTLDKWTPKMLREAPSEEKEAMALGMLYRGDGIKSIIKNPALRDAYYSGSAEDMQRAVSDFYEKKLPERANNHNKFFSSKSQKTEVPASIRKKEPWTPAKFENYQFKPKNKYSEGGYMSNLWDNLSMKEKSEMMRVAIANGITSLPEIKQAYNKFAKGGRMNNWTMQDEAGYRYWRQNLPKNLRETDDNIYDMRAAYKAGMQPEWNEEDKSYHLGSRDPESGRILKSPNHSTFLKALIEDAELGYYPTMDSNGKVYTETWEGNKYGNGGYAPSESIKKRITNWEGESMKTNRSFAAEARDFNAAVPAEVRSKLSSKQLDALFSYGYNVGMGNLKRRVLPALTAYTEGKASKEDVQRSMWAAKDNELRGLTTRRNAEREMFGGNYRTSFTGTGKLGLHLDPKEFTYYEDLTPMINSISIPQLQSDTDDPELRYKAPAIDTTLFQQPKEAKAVEPVYNPQEDRLEGLRNFNTVMGLMGQQSPFAALGNNDNAGLLSYIGQIYT